PSARRRRRLPGEPAVTTLDTPETPETLDDRDNDRDNNRADDGAQALHDALHHTWADQPGVPGFFNTVDHKRIGVRYVYTAFAFFVFSGVLALIMRVQLAQPNASALGPEAYNGLFSMHGIGMIFLFNTPVL